MKSNWKIFSLVAAAAMLFSSCDKVKDLPLYGNGKTSVLSSSVTTLAPAPTDSNNAVVTFSWTSPEYKQDPLLYKYAIEIDSANGDFLRAKTKVVKGVLTASMTGKEINTILLGYGFEFNVAHDLYVRLITSYGNSNESYTSNVIKISAKAYKVPPKIALPLTERLFIVGGASDFGWDNNSSPLFPAAREFARTEETKWVGIFNLKANEAYKVLQKQGDWDSQFRMLPGGTAEAGEFDQKNADPAFPSPTETGKYKIIMNFQTGKFSTVKVDNLTPDALYVTGDAAANGWTNSPGDEQKFTRLNSAEFEITIALEAGKSFKFLSKYGDWHPQIGGTSSTGGTLVEKYGNDDAPTASPAETGTYKINVNFATGLYTVVKQ
jgi:starch-binding outer membrane protein SusE/F